MIRGAAKGIEDGDDDQGDTYDEESVFRGILAGLLSPEPFQGIQHGNTFRRWTLDMNRNTREHVQKIQEVIYHFR